MNNKPIDLNRRGFLKISAAMGGGLLLSIHLAARSGQANARKRADGDPMASFEPNAWIRIANDDSVTLIVHKSEMGQGVMTALPMLIAEELEVDWSRVRTEFARVDPVYKNPAIGVQLTAGSTSVMTCWEALRQAGAMARELLIAAAADTWGVATSECRAAEGTVLHEATGRGLRYGELVQQALRLPAPENVPLKSSSEFKIIGQPVGRLDARAKVDGSAVFGIDVQIPGTLVATVVHPPVFGSTMKTFDATRTKGLKGVHHVLTINTGLAVVADTFWQARQGADALQIEWERSENDDLDSERIRERRVKLARTEGQRVRDDGDVDKALGNAVKTLHAVYEVPYQAHATPEPMNCTAHVRTDRCDIWAPTQNQDLAQEVAARITGLDYEAVRVHTTFLGGGFGRRIEGDYVAEAVQISRAVHRPVKVIWSREEDIQHDFYRPATYNELWAGLDDNGRPTSWAHRIVGPAIMDRIKPLFVPMLLPRWLPSSLRHVCAGMASHFLPRFTIDDKATEGADNLAYAIENVRVDFIKDDPGIPTGFWRSVGHSQNAFVVESFIDEVAAVSGMDPFIMRCELLKEAPRQRGVLELAARKADWGSSPPEGIHRGLAVHEYGSTAVAQVADISVDEKIGVKVHRVVCAVDCGIVIHPRIVEAQMESAVAWGLTSTLKSAVTIRGGRVEQSGFDDFPLLRLDEMPEVEVHIVPSTHPPGGIGEAGVPPVAPAIANAVFAATGKRIRTLPIRRADLLDF